MKRLTMNQVSRASLRANKKAYLSLAIGILLAVFLRKEGPQKEVYHWDEEDEENEESGSSTGSETDNQKTEEKPYWDVPTPSNEELTVRYRFRH